MLVGRLLVAAVLGYLIGAFPTGVVVTRLLKKPDVRFSGSGHIGGLNVYRLAGVVAGAITALVDMGKGVLAAWLALRLAGTPWALPAAGMAAVAGHCWPVYIGFHGGMGLGTLVGLFFWQQPLLPFVGAALWGLAYLPLRDSPRAVMLMAVLMVPVFWLFDRLHLVSPQAMALGIGGLGVIFLRHLTQLPAYDRRRKSKPRTPNCKL
ncbi:MAG: glycerol-3-phosphate acyltransferase [Anaerolineae bacterium]|nr:glycerol-3-phosphate acyltransferase [Anaerolineae bacterium]